MNEITKLRRIHEQLVKRGVDKYYYNTEDIGNLLAEIDGLEQQLNNLNQQNKTPKKSANSTILHGGKF